MRPINHSASGPPFYRPSASDQEFQWSSLPPSLPHFTIFLPQVEVNVPADPLRVLRDTKVTWEYLLFLTLDHHFPSPRNHAGLALPCSWPPWPSSWLISSSQLHRWCGDLRPTVPGGCCSQGGRAPYHHLCQEDHGHHSTSPPPSPRPTVITVQVTEMYTQVFHVHNYMYIIILKWIFNIRYNFCTQYIINIALLCVNIIQITKYPGSFRWRWVSVHCAY